MSTIENMQKRYIELESIASNPNIDKLIRKSATDERISIYAMMQNQRAADQKEAARIDARRLAGDAHDAKAQALMDQMAEVGNELARAPVGSDLRRNLNDRAISLRLELQRLQTFGGV
jgi:hypothetical protein